MVDGTPRLSDLGWTEFFARQFAVYETDGLRPARVVCQEELQRELRFLARRQRWAKMKKHQPRPSGPDSGDDE
jgi:hypothetical protein